MSVRPAITLPVRTLAVSTLAALAIIVALAAPASVHAQVFEPRTFADPAQQERYQALIKELRCLVCQNQNIADSNADLAADLRREVYQMIVDGKSDPQIIEFMVARYGDFVLYRPPLKPTTAALWSAPFVLVVVGVAYLLVLIRRRARTLPEEGLSDEEREQLRELLEENGERAGNASDHT